MKQCGATGKFLNLIRTQYDGVFDFNLITVVAGERTGSLTREMYLHTSMEFTGTHQFFDTHERHPDEDADCYNQKHSKWRCRPPIPMRL